jgi:hypothetical protein
MKRATKKIIKQQGWALLVITTMLMVLLTVSTFDIVLVNVRQVKDADIYTAINNGEKVAIATVSPIKRKIVETLHAELKPLMEQRMAEIVQMTGGGSGLPPKGGSTGTSGTTVPRTSCITSIDPKATIEDQYGICEPMKLLDGLQGLSIQKQTIDFLSAMKPRMTKAQSGNPDYDYQLRELQRESFNEFDYTLTTTFVSANVLTRNTGRPRVELYRYLVTADVEVQTYSDVYNQMRVDFDVVVQVGARGGTDVSPCGGSQPIGNIRAASFLMGYTQCVGGVGGKCTLVPKGSTEYNTGCNEDCESGLQKLNNGIPFGALTPAEQAAVSDKQPIGEPRELSGVGGCASGGNSSTPGFHRNLYRWDIVVRPVGMGHNYY